VSVGVGEPDGLPLPVSVGVGEPVGLPLPVSVGVGEPVGLPLPVSVGVAVGVGEPAEVVGVGVTDGLGVAHDGVGVGDALGVDARFCTSSSALVTVPLATAVVGADEVDPVLVTAVVSAAAQVEDVVGLGEAPPLAVTVPAPWDRWPSPDGVEFAPDGPVALPVREPSPSAVPAPPLGELVPPLRTVLLA
jgi:hypothetical protein